MSVAELPERLDRPEAGPAAFGTAMLFVLAILIGSGLGLVAPSVGDSLAGSMDATLLTMICLLFFELRLGAVFRAFGNLRFLALAWCANFLIVPAIGFAIASVVLSGEPLLFAGLMIYFLAPCTDWFLGFTRMARGDTELGATLIPINLITQLMLFPIWLWLFTPAPALVDFDAMPGVLVQWFLLPLVGAQALRTGLAWILPVKTCKQLLSLTSQLLPLVLTALIVQIFGAHVRSITANVDVFASIAVAVFLFFAATLYLGAGLARFSRLAHPQQVLLSMTLTARNAPLMLALTAVAIPDQPLVLAVIVFGMLVEIPHLTALKQLLLRRSPTNRGDLDVRRANHI